MPGCSVVRWLYKTMPALPDHTRFMHPRIVTLKTLNDVFYWAVGDELFRVPTLADRNLALGLATPRVVEDIESATSDHKIGRSGIGYRRWFLIKQVPHREPRIPPLTPTVMTESCTPGTPIISLAIGVGAVAHSVTANGVGTVFCRPHLGLTQPFDLAFDAEGNLYMSNRRGGPVSSGSVLKFTLME